MDDVDGDMSRAICCMSVCVIVFVETFAVSTRCLLAKCGLSKKREGEGDSNKTHWSGAADRQSADQRSKVQNA